MITNHTIIRILREAALLLKHDYHTEDLRFVEINNRDYQTSDFTEFKRDLTEAAGKINLQMMEYTLAWNEFKVFIEKEQGLVLAITQENNKLVPVLVFKERRKRYQIRFDQSVFIAEPFALSPESSLEEVSFFAVMPAQNLVSDFQWDAEEGKEIKPVRRFLRLLRTERKDIFYILFYAVIAGIISLILPLGIQTTVELVSGGLFFSSVYVLIGVVIVGIIVAGVLQIIQLSLVEYLQQRIFAKASLEFAFRIPRLRTEALEGRYAPELINRFFDVITIQKGMPKLLIDLSASVIQIFTGLFLLSLYHPFFVFFSVILLGLLVAMFYITGPKGLSSSISESKYKYKVVHWLEELARAINSFKLAGNTDLPIRKTDNHVNNYLKYRKIHFNVLVTQFSFAVFFKAAIIGGLLIIGTMLVIDRQITLGQFVAAEVIIILVMTSIEKIILYMDVVYDLLTAVDKVGMVTDLPLERPGGVDIHHNQAQKSYALEVKNLKYKYDGAEEYTLKGIDLKINPGEHVCISGPGSSGKTTLTNIMAGLYSDYEGVVTINNHSIRDLDLAHLRDKIAKNISQEDIFDGTILENITVGKPMESVQDAVDALDLVSLSDYVNQLPDGLQTHLVSAGKGWSNTNIHKLILARCLAKKPALIILNDFFMGLKQSSKLELTQCVVDKNQHWTLVAVSNDPLVMAACDRVVVMSEGLIEAEGPYDELLKSGIITKVAE